MNSHLSRRSFKNKMLAGASFAALGLSITGCAAIMPNSSTEIGREKLDQVHEVTYTVKAPFGSNVVYSDGEQTLTSETNNLNEWSFVAEVEGIKKVSVAVTANPHNVTDLVPTCTITVDEGTPITRTAVNGPSGTAECQASTELNQ